MECAKIENEPCGGKWGVEGQCDEENGLKCTVPSRDFLSGKNVSGICVRKYFIRIGLVNIHLLLAYTIGTNCDCTYSQCTCSQNQIWNFRLTVHQLVDCYT